MPEIKRIDHVAILVENIETSLKFWQDILGMKAARVAENPLESARIAFFPLGESEIELVEPTTDNSGLSRYLEKHGAGMHHVCLEVDDLPGMLVQLESNGIQLINQQPRVADDGKLYAFVHPKSTGGVLVELYQV